LHQLSKKYQINYQLQKLKPIMSTKILNALADEYGFGAKKAKEFLIEKGLVKVPKKRQASPKAEKSVTKKASNEDKPKTKRGTNAYFLYCKTERPNIKAKLLSEAEESGEEVKYDVVKKTVNDSWKALSADKKMIWSEEAKAVNKVNSESESQSESETEQTEQPEEVENDYERPLTHFLLSLMTH